MFLKCHSRFKDGKEHRYWNIVENRRCGRGKFVQRQVLYLGEINDSQRESWCRTIEVFDENRERTMPLALFSADRQLPNFAAGFGVQVRLKEMELHRPRQWVACWLACAPSILFSSVHKKSPDIHRIIALHRTTGCKNR